MISSRMFSDLEDQQILEVLRIWIKVPVFRGRDFSEMFEFQAERPVLTFFCFFFAPDVWKSTNLPAAFRLRPPEVRRLRGSSAGSPDGPSPPLRSLRPSADQRRRDSGSNWTREEEQDFL